MGQYSSYCYNNFWNNLCMIEPCPQWISAGVGMPHHSHGPPLLCYLIPINPVCDEVMGACMQGVCLNVMVWGIIKNNI